MQINEHLVETFYITKPEAQFEMTEESFVDKINEVKEQNILEQKNNQKEERKKVKIGGGKYKRVFNMMSKQIHCSAAVKITERVHSVGQQEKVKQKNGNIVHQFQQFFKGFIDIDQDDLNTFKRRNSKKKTTHHMRYRSSESIEQERSSLIQEQEDEELILTNEGKKKEKENLDYYERMKRKLDGKVGHLVKKDYDKKLKYGKVEMAQNQNNLEVNTILKDKDKVRRFDRLRMSRTGLPIKLSDMDRHAKGTNLVMIQDYKRKKDIFFQKSLAKNAHAILSDIENFQNLHQKSRKSSLTISIQKQKHKKPSRNGLSSKKYQSHKQFSTSRKEYTDIDHLKWKQKYLNIEYQCKTNYKKNEGIKDCLKVFKKYCGKIQKRFQTDKTIIKKIIKTDVNNLDKPFRYEDITNLNPAFLQLVDCE